MLAAGDRGSRMVWCSTSRAARSPCEGSSSKDPWSWSGSVTTDDCSAKEQAAQLRGISKEIEAAGARLVFIGNGNTA